MGRAPLSWQRSHACAQEACVEVHIEASQVLVRDSKDPDGPILRFTTAEWKAFLDGASAGQFDPGA